MRMPNDITPMTVGGADYIAISGEVIESRNPATGELNGTFPAAGKEDVDVAVAAAAHAFREWRRSTPAERAEVLFALAEMIEENAEELSQIDVADNGSPIIEMRKDAGTAIAQLRYFGGLTYEARGDTIPGSWGRLNYTLEQPYGVVGRIIPFNHPFMFAASKIAAPLAAGNTVIIKPSEHTSLSALRLGELSRGLLPDGVFNVVTGYGNSAGDAIVRHPDVRRLAFIGASATGRGILAAAASVNVKSVTLELGGKNPLVVFDNADLDKAIEAAKRGMNFSWQGQSCGSTSRLFVQRGIYEEFLTRLGASVDAMRQGLPSDETTETGAIVNSIQFEKVKHYLAVGAEDGGRLVAGGHVVDTGAFAEGFFVRPTVFADVDPSSRLAQEEVFGPILAVTPFDDYDDAIRLANSVAYGLTASVFSKDLATVHRFARDVEAGYVWANDVSRHIAGTAFGGVKDSGLGREEGIEEMFSYLQPKNVHINFDE